MDPFRKKYLRTHCYFIVIYTLCVYCLPIYAQSFTYEFELYTLSDGLADNMIYKIEQDQNGFLWIATQNGLSRFDGQSFTNFSNFDSVQYLRRNQINDIFITEDQLLYLSTDNGIDVFDPNEGLVQSILPETGMPNDYIETVIQDKSGKFWLSSNRKFSFQFTDDFTSFQNRYPLLNPNDFDYKNHLIYEFKEWNGVVYARASQNEIWKLNERGEIEEKYTLNDSIMKESLASPYGFCFDQNGTIWAVFLANGLAYVDTLSNSIVRHPISDKIVEPWKTTIEINKKEELWIGGIDMLYKYNPWTDSLLRFSEPLIKLVDGVQLRVLDLFVDRENILWMGTNLGLIKVKEKRKLVTHYFEGQAIRAIAESIDSSIFVGKYYSVEILKPNSGKVNQFPIKNYVENDKQIFLMDPTSLIVDDSILWLRGMSSYDLKSGQYTERETASHFDYVSTVDHKGIHWVAGEKLLQIYDSELDSFVSIDPPLENFNIEETNITAIYQTKDHKIWFGTNRGLFYMDYDNKTAYPLKFDDKDLSKRINDARVNCFYEDHNGKLWIGTNGGGVFSFQFDNRELMKFNVTNGLPSNYVFGVLPEGDSCLWFSTANGLSRFHYETALFSNYNEEDGLLNSKYQKYSFLKSKNERFYFGGDKGLDAFYPQDLVSLDKMKSESNILMTQYSKYDGRTNLKEEYVFNLSKVQKIELDYYERDLEIEYTLLELGDPQKHLYSWRLMGYADQWSEPTQERSIRFQSLPTGEFTFQVRASSGKSNWNDSMFSIQVVKHQAWYQSPWFFIGLGVLFGVLIFLYQRERYAEQLKVTKQKELLRTKISHDLHDDVGGILTGLTMQSELLELKTEGQSKLMAKKIKYLGREALSRMRDTVWAMDANKDDVNSLFDRMKDHAELTLGPSELAYNFDVTSPYQNQMLPPNIRQQTYLIYKEAITNAAKHSNGTWVKIEVIVQAKNLIMKIIDNGEVLHQKTSGLGIGSMKDRAASVKGELKIIKNHGYLIQFSVSW